MSVLSRDFWADAGERAVKTVAQTLVALLTADVIDVVSLDWGQLLGVSVGAGLVSVLTSIASTNYGDEDSPSLVHKHKE